MTKHKIIQTVADLKNLRGAKRFEFVAKCWNDETYYRAYCGKYDRIVNLTLSP